MARYTPRDVLPHTRSLPGGPMAETFEAYRTRVLSYLGDEEPIGVQQATPSQLDWRLRDVAPEGLIRRPAPEKWSIAEIVAHLADAELAMGWRLRNMLANPGVALTWWDEAVWAERLGYAQQEASLSAGGFRALRESNLRLLESVPGARVGGRPGSRNGSGMPPNQLLQATPSQQVFLLRLI